MTKHLRKNKLQLIIIGGGASGLAAACMAAKQGIETLVIEKNDRLGKKLLATGNGRCNLMNTGTPCFFGDASFAEQVIGRFGAKDLLRFFSRLGLVCREEDGGRVYPACGRAETVLDVLTLPLFAAGIEVRTGSQAIAIRRLGNAWQVETAKDGSFEAPFLLMAGGSPAAAKLGGSDSMSQLLSPLGLAHTAPLPALTALITPSAPLQGLNGLRMPAQLSLLHQQKILVATRGEMLIAADGISGVCAMQLGNTAARLLSERQTPVLNIDLSPLLGLLPLEMSRIPPSQAQPDTAKVLAFLNERAAFLPPGKQLTGALPRALEKKLQAATPAQTAHQLTHWQLPVTGVRDMNSAQVASGGILTREVDAATMECKRFPGLYLAGELLNVDGDCGGFNLMFAFSSGILAVQSIQKKLSSTPGHPG